MVVHVAVVDLEELLRGGLLIELVVALVALIACQGVHHGNFLVDYIDLDRLHCLLHLNSMKSKVNYFYISCPLFFLY